MLHESKTLQAKAKHVMPHGMHAPCACTIMHHMQYSLYRIQTTRLNANYMRMCLLEKRRPMHMVGSSRCPLYRSGTETLRTALCTSCVLDVFWSACWVASWGKREHLASLSLHLFPLLSSGHRSPNRNPLLDRNRCCWSAVLSSLVLPQDLY